MRKIFVKCSCGGGAEVVVDPEATNAITECACTKVLLWSGEAENSTWDHNPPTLGISVGDGARAIDKFGR